ncbi:MAG: bifunctional folylpolyglutamate synthase/dihydrofolate synthase [Candidatus Cohnella colombiensis]|uniref:Dihydrofolate synthase/folylpolyglutamate synthase n=1 Tax=Candidatus Cohnella colombiensis TaxID=3121368 RepID=A0AA95EXK3_9BACL|nr:MAG: bifunctional folylpolyglutamate synthase/dihydrofolate synthase [Cohnella sp.]
MDHLNPSHHVQEEQVYFRLAEEAMAWITGLTPFGIRPGLDRITLMMERFNNPQRRLKFIHVAGTNGKGSVCAYLTQILRQSRYDVGTFTSPYLTSYSNRLQYNGQDIADADLITLTNRLKPVADELSKSEWGSPTMFEVTTALALLYYGTISFPDYVVWETGLGGRLDVTNIVTPVVSVITNVGHDHMDVLGSTLEEIAREKAGIIKPGVPVITAVNQPDIVEIMKQTAAGNRSTAYIMGEQFSVDVESAVENNQQFKFTGPFRSLNSLAITLNGAHQVVNAAVAVMTIEVLRQYYALIVEDSDLIEALQSTSWPGRLELVSTAPRILIDGAHNPEGVEALATTLRNIYKYDQLNVVMAMMPNKNHEQSLRHILPMVDTLIITEPDFHKKMNATELAAVANGLQAEFGRPRSVVVEPDWRRALSLLQDLSTPTSQYTNPLGVVTGTLYLIADVRSWILHETKSEKGW